MELDFSQNYFELFDLPPGFELDSETLALRYRDLQRATHPDRYANASDRERRLSVQHASHINEAFRVLKDPLSRARYLLELNGVPFDEHASNMDPAFLMQQMELREALEGVRTQADPFAALMGLRDDAEARERALVEELAACFTQGGKAALERVPELIRKLQFMRKLVEEAEELEEDLVHQM